jgi:hypothetical protein
MPLFHPSMVVTLNLRFDEALTLAGDQPATPHAQSDVDRANTPTPIDLDSALAGPGTPLIAQPGASSHLTNLVPLKASVELTGLRHAWKFELEFAFRDLPIDFRTIRTIGVEIHLGAVRDDDFANGMVHTDANGVRTSVLRPSDDNLLMPGLVDEWDQTFDEASGTVKMSGRDLRGILLDYPMSAEALNTLDLSKPIDEVVRAILRLHPLAQAYPITVRPDEWKDGVTLPSPGVLGDATRVRAQHHRGARGRPRAAARATSHPRGGANGTSYWDVITHYCNLVGAVPHFAGKTLLLRPARDIFQTRTRQGFDPRFPTPFARGAPRIVTDEGGANLEEIRTRRFVYGRNIKKLHFSRKQAGITPRIVEAVSIDTSSRVRGLGRQIAARWPSTHDGVTQAQVDAASTTAVAPGGQAAMTAVLRVPVAGIASVDRLREIAKDIYEEVMRGELGGSVETSDLASFGFDVQQDNNADPDDLRIFPSDAVELLTDTRSLSAQAPLVSDIVDASRRSFAEQVAEVQTRIPDPNIARVIVATARNQVIGLEPFFRVSNVKYTWDAKSLGIAFDFQNYIVARSGLTQTANEKRSGATAVQQNAQTSGALSPGEQAQQQQSRARIDRNLRAAGVRPPPGLVPPGGAAPAPPSTSLRTTTVPSR